MRERRFQNIGDPRRRDRFRSTYELGVQSPFVFHAVYAYERAFTFMEATLTERGPWLLGEKVTLADINMMPLVARLAYLGLLEAWTSTRPRINAWWARTQEWPSFGPRRPRHGDRIRRHAHAWPECSQRYPGADRQASQREGVSSTRWASAMTAQATAAVSISRTSSRIVFAGLDTASRVYPTCGA
jgi:glutathione S-transferase